MSAVELAVGYVTIAAEASGISKQLGKEFTAGEKQAASAGKRMGKRMAEGIESSAPDLSNLRKEVETSEAKVTATIERNSQAQAKARRQVEIAEAELEEKRNSGRVSASQLMKAEDKLATARQRSEAASMKARNDLEKYNTELERSKTALREAETAAENASQGIEGSFKGIGGRIKAAMAGDFKAAFKGVEGDAAKSAKEVSQEFSAAGDEAADGFGDKFVGGMKGLPGAVAGLGLGLSMAEGITSGMERERLGDKLGAQLGLTGEESKRWGEVAGRLYAGAYGESLEEVHEGVSAVMSTLGGSAEEVENLTAIALDLSSAMGVDVAEATAAAGTMMRNGLAKDATHAFDIITGGMQNVPAHVREEILPAMTEYSKHFEMVGIDGEKAMSLIIDASADGAIGIDKIADAAKELGVRVGNVNDKAASEALATMGLDAEAMASAFAEGGPTAEAALGQIVGGLRDMRDPAERNAVALDLFGTQIEDIGLHRVPEFLESLDPATEAQYNFADASKNMGDTLNNNAATAFESFKRQLSQGFVDTVGNMAIAFGNVYEAVKPVGDWLNEHKGTWGPFAIGIGLVAGAVIGWKVATALLTAGLWGQAAALAAAYAPITAVVIGVGLLVGAVIWAYNNVEWFRDLIDTAWAKIKEWTGALVRWWTETAFPALMNAVGWLGDKMSWLMDNVIRPVWDTIKFLIAVAVGSILTAWDGLVWVAENVLAPMFRWLYDSVIKPVWDMIKSKIDVFVAWWSNVAWPKIRNVLQWVGDKFKWLYNNAIKPAWDWVRDKLSSGWAFIRDKVFAPLMSALADKVAPAFEKAKDAISRAWSKIKSVVSKPVEFVINTIIRDNLIKNINKILDTFGMQEIKFAGVNLGGAAAYGGNNRGSEFFNGGYTGNMDPHRAAGVVHGDEHVIRSKSRRDIEKTSPGLLDAMNKFGASALPFAGHDGHSAHGGMAAGGPGGPGTYLWGGLQNSIYASGVAHVRGSAPGYDLAAAARAWNNIGNLKVKYGTGPNQINVGSGAPPGTWGYAWTNGQIQLNPGIPGNMKTGVAAHEIGHVLGLDHAGTNSIMHPMMRGPLWPSAFDRSSIQRIYGGSGKGNPPEGGGGGFDIVGMLMGGVDKLLGGVKDKFSGTGMDIALGAGRFLIDKAKEWVTGGFGGASAKGGSPALFDGGGWLNQGLQLVDHQRAKPDAVLPYERFQDFHQLAQSVESGASGAPLVGNLYAFDADEAMQKLEMARKKREALYV